MLVKYWLLYNVWKFKTTQGKLIPKFVGNSIVI